MNNLEKILVGKAESTSKKQEELLEGVKLLLANNEAEELKTLSSIGLDFNLKLEQDALGLQLTKQASKKHLDRNVVSRQEIRELCRDYRLYLKPARLYKGAIPRELASELTRFCKEKSIVLPSHSDHSDFYIVAPPKMFANYLSGKDRLKEAWGNAIEYRKEIQRLKDQDPILLYRVQKSDDPTKDLYSVIKSWGNDFTPLRRLYGFLTQPFVVSSIMCILMWMCVGLSAYLSYELISFSTVEWKTITTFWMGFKVFVLDMVGFWLLTVGTIWWLTDVQNRAFRRELYNNLIRENFASEVRPKAKSW